MSRLLSIDLGLHCGAITDFVMNEEERKQLKESFPDFEV